jgi:two-component system LytT family sensor kinase
MKRQVIYWLCQIFGWGVYLFFLLAMMSFFGGEGSLNRSSIILQVIIYICLIFYSHLFKLYILKKDWLNLKVTQLIPRAILGTLILAVIVQATIHLVIYHIIKLTGLMPFDWGSFATYVFNVFVVLILWSAIYFAIKFIEKNRKTELEKLELKAALQEAELMVLKNQVNPHFLFNALNNIRSLILIEPDKARKMVTHISDLLRYSIQFNTSEKVPLKDEIEIVKDYLVLESIQYTDRLNYTFDVDPETETLAIPPMAIQLLVENAIKHGLSTQTNGGTVWIKAQKSDGHLLIEVANSGQMNNKPKREGIGLKNLVERMKILFGPFAEFKLENTAENTVTASLKIPIS